MNKTKILIISDHALSTSGVAIQSKYLIEGLVNTGKYKVVQIGAARYHEDLTPQKVNKDFTILPCVGFGDKETIRSLLVSEKPDALIVFTDIRFFSHIWNMEDEIHEVCPILYWHVWDNYPVPDYNDYVYNSVDKVNCISHLTYDLLKSKHRDKIEYVPHGLPTKDFYQFTKEEIDKYRSSVLSDKKEWFVGLWVNRNIRRKRPADVIMSWKIFLEKLEKEKGHKNALLIMHTDPEDKNGTDLIKVAKHLNVEKNLRFSREELGFKELNMLHNISDVCINISFAEGFGLTTLQSLYTGTPIVVSDTGGLSRQCTNPSTGEQYGIAIKPAVTTISGVLDTPYINEDYVTTEDTASAILKICIEKQNYSNASNYAVQEFNLEDSIKKWDQSIQEEIIKSKNKKYFRIKEF